VTGMTNLDEQYIRELSDYSAIRNWACSAIRQ